MNTKKLKELRNALSCWQDDYDCDDDKEQYDMFGAAIDAVSRLEAAELEIEGLKRFQDLNLKIKQAMHERFTRAERERDELRAEQAEHDDQIARMEGKFSLAKRALDSKTARCEKAEAELRRRDAGAGEPVAWRYRATNMFGDLLDAWKLSETKNQTGTCQPLYTAAKPAVVPDIVRGTTSTPFNSSIAYSPETAFIAGANWMREQCLALGAQQQKAVELDNVFSVNVAGVAVRVVLLKDVSTSLDAANVKWEVKP